MNKSPYHLIMQSALIFGAIQAYTLLTKAIVNKIAAILLGPTGVGLISVIQSLVFSIKTVAALGIPQSAIKEISAIKSHSNEKELTNIIHIVSVLIISTSITGFLISLPLTATYFTRVIDQKISLISIFGVSLAVFLNIYFDGQLAKIKGLRAMKILAQLNVFSATFTLFISLLVYYKYRENGIILVFVLTPLAGILLSKLLHKKSFLYSKQHTIPFTTAQYSPIIKTGISLSLATILSQLSNLIITTFIAKNGGKIEVGLYSSGTMLMIGYFSAIIAALTTDYYPRIAAKSTDNNELNKELNRQSIVTAVICAPLIACFLTFTPFIIKLLYSNEFISIEKFVRIGITGTLITVFSNQIDLILVVKGNRRLYIFISIIYRCMEVIIFSLMYKLYGLDGLGWSILVMATIHGAIMIYYTSTLYSIKYDKESIKIFMMILIIAISSILTSQVDDYFLKCFLHTIIIIYSFYLSLSYIKKVLNVSLISLFR